MKSVRITRKVDELGRIVIPSEIRKHLDVEPGTDLDVELRGEEVVISTPDSKVTVWVIPTNEELMIAQDTAALTR